MRKLKLSLDELRVDSFHATDAASGRGTVAGNSFTQYADESCFQSCNGTCNTCNSCYGGCGSGATCGATCGCPPGTGYTDCGCQTWETCPNATVCA